jgi:hypothetical protein
MTALTGPWDGPIEWTVGLYTFSALGIALGDMGFRQAGNWAVRLRRFVSKMREGS